MKLAHVRDRSAPSATPWRLAAALDDPPTHWLDLEVARRRALARDGSLADDPVFGTPVTTLDDHLVRDLRVDRLAALVHAFVPDGPIDRAVLDAGDLAFGPPILQPTSLRDGFGFEAHVRMVWERRGRPIPAAWYETPTFFFENVTGIRGPDAPVWAPQGSSELDFELEVAALVDVAGIDLSAADAEGAIGGYLVFNDWSARDLQRDEARVGLGPAKGKDFACSLGPWLVTPDELEDVRLGHGFDLAMTASVNGDEVSRARWSDITHGLPALIGRASADVRLRPGDVFGSGTAGTGCLLEVGAATIGRYLAPGDEVTLAVERLGELRTPIVARPG